MENQIILTTWLDKNAETFKMLNKYYDKGVTSYRLNCAKGKENDMTWLTCAEILREFYAQKRSRVNIMLDSKR